MRFFHTIARTMVALALISFALPGCKEKQATKAQLAELRKAVTKAEARVRGHIDAWRAGIRKLGTGPLPATTGACPKPASTTMLFGRVVLRLSHLKGLDKLTPWGFRTTLKRIGHIRDATRPGQKVRAKRARRMLVRLKQPYRTKYLCILVVQSEKLPRVRDAKTFDAGYLKGRVLVWSFEDARFVCATDIEEHTSKKMTLYGRGPSQQKLVKTLETHAIITAERKLRALR